MNTAEQPMWKHNPYLGHTKMPDVGWIAQFGHVGPIAKL